MKLFLLASLTLLLGFGATNAYPWPISLFLLSFLSLSTLLRNYWLVNGGLAWRNHHHELSSQLVGPVGWPLFGSLFQMGSLAHRNLAAIAASSQATRLMSLSLGATRVIISSHPDTAKEILSGSSFTDRPVKQSAHLLMFERTIGFAPAGTYWRHLRRIAGNHLFSPRKISGLEELRQQVAEEMLKRVHENMEKRGVVKLREILQKGSLDNMLESVFGSGMDSERKEELSEAVREGYELISKFNLEDYFPLSFLDFNGVKRKCVRLAARVRNVVGDIIEERKRVDRSCWGSDFLSTLLSLPTEEQLKHSDMVAILWEMIFRGTDTVAILLEWTMARMVLHQDLQAKAQQEIDAWVGKQRHVQDSDISKLPYLQAIVKEVLRLHPPGPLLSWARLAVHDVHVDKKFIPAGTTAMVNMWAITHDPTIWKDPWTFSPERFMEQEFSIMGSDLRLAPFGSGRRICPGRALGLATAQLWLANLLQRFRWVPVRGPGSKVDLSECLRLSLEMKKPLFCSVVSR